MLEVEQTLLAIVALEDPLRDRVKQVVNYAEMGNVNIRMITNNSLETAKAVAVKCNILASEHLEQSAEIQHQFAMHAADFRTSVGGIREVTDEDGKINYLPGN